MNLPDAMKAAARPVLVDLMREVRAIQAVVIATEDGFELAAHAQNKAQISRLSAMASSMGALGVMAGEESRLGACESITVEAAEGYILMLQARHQRVTLILSIIASRDAIMGEALFYGRQAVRRLEKL